MKRLILFIIVSYLFTFFDCYSQQKFREALKPASLPGTPDFTKLFFTLTNTFPASSVNTTVIFKTTGGEAAFCTPAKHIQQIQSYEVEFKPAIRYQQFSSVCILSTDS